MFLPCVRFLLSACVHCADYQSAAGAVTPGDPIQASITLVGSGAASPPPLYVKHTHTVFVLVVLLVVLLLLLWW